MKIYFTASITYRKQFKETYLRIIKELKRLGHKVNAIHVLEHNPEKVKHHSDEQRFKDYEEMLGWIADADIVVVEATFPSTVTTGHVLTRALERGKPVLSLYQRDDPPPLLLGLEMERFRLVEYDLSDLEKVIKQELEELMKLPDQRFTMLLPSKITDRLDRVSEAGMSRSEYIRNLILQDMEKKKR